MEWAFGAGVTVDRAPPPPRDFIPRRPRPMGGYAESDRIYELQVWLQCTKQCGSCGRQMPLDMFSDGRAWCDPCRTEHGLAANQASSAARLSRRWQHRDAFVMPGVRRAS